MKLSSAAELVRAIGSAEAKGLGSEDLVPEHLMLGVLKVGDLPDIPLKGAKRHAAETEIAHLTAHLEGAMVPAKWMRRRLRWHLDHPGPGESSSGQSGDSDRAALARAAELAEEAGDDRVRAIDLLSACLDSSSATLESLFAEFTVDADTLRPDATARAELMRRLHAGEGKEGTHEELRRNESDSETIEQSPLAEYGRDLTALAKAKKLGPVIGRRQEMKEIAQILISMKKNNAVLLGDPGVGKTAVVEGLALYAAGDDAADALRDRHFVEVSMASLISGAKYRGDFEERLQKIVAASKEDPNLVLFVDEIHTMLGAGAGADGSMNAANILKPALERGEVRMIGATTTTEYRKYFERDEALKRRFRTVWIDEPSPEETLGILEGLRSRLQEHHHLTIPDEVMVAAVDLAQRYLIEGFFPDKAIVVLDQACATRRLLTFSPTEEQRETLEVQDVARVVSSITQMPLDVVLGRVASAPRDDQAMPFDKEAFRSLLAGRVVGQDRAVDVLANAVGRKRAGVTDPSVPVVVLFAGPSGTGKTELAKATASALFDSEERLIRLDMTEFREPHSGAKIIGSPPGYVGYGEETPLVRDVRRYPYSVVLLDEIEKAHRDILTVFMPVFDEGKLTTSDGKTVSFSDAIIVLTSNLGISAQKPGLGIVLEEQMSDSVKDARAAVDLERNVRQAVRKHLLPELLNRIQELVIFQPLSRQAVHHILDIHVAKLNERLADRRIHVELDEGAKDWVMEQGYSTEYGARHLIRALERWVSDPLSDAINSGRVKVGCTVTGRRGSADPRQGLDFDIECEDANRTLTLPPRTED